MGFFGNVFKKVQNNFGPISKVIRKTVGEKSSLLGTLVS